MVRVLWRAASLVLAGEYVAVCVVATLLMYSKHASTLPRYFRDVAFATVMRCLLFACMSLALEPSQFEPFQVFVLNTVLDVPGFAVLYAFVSVGGGWLNDRLLFYGYAAPAARLRSATVAAFLAALLVYAALQVSVAVIADGGIDATGESSTFIVATFNLLSALYLGFATAKYVSFQALCGQPRGRILLALAAGSVAVLSCTARAVTVLCTLFFPALSISNAAFAPNHRTAPFLVYYTAVEVVPLLLISAIMYTLHSGRDSSQAAVGGVSFRTDATSPLRHLTSILPDEPPEGVTAEQLRALRGALEGTLPRALIIRGGVRCGTRIGAGGSGQVYRGTYHDAPVALKELYVVAMGGDAEEFRDEAVLMATLHHPNIVRFVGVYCPLPQIFIVTELMKQPLSSVIAPPLSDARPPRLGIERVVRITRDVSARGISSGAHARARPPHAARPADRQRHGVPARARHRAS